MADDIPRSKWSRGLTGSRTAARMGGKALKYLALKPFQTKEQRLVARKALNREAGAVLFEGLSLLRGTALKTAQLLSMELDIFPPEIREELKKSYHEAPPINRALVRKVVQNALGKPPEQLFQTFDSRAFAAASLGQVHRATTIDGCPLAVKIQYPGIRETIENDVRMMRAVLRSLPDYRMLVPALAEIEARLLEETDYRRELDNMAFFRARLDMDRIMVPAFRSDLSADTVLAAEYVNGQTLGDWLKTGPDQEQRDRVAQALQDLFLFGFYELHCIHADPNPGNFIVCNDGKIGLVDFGCVKHFDAKFVVLYEKLSKVIMDVNRDECMPLFEDLGLASNALEQAVKDQIFEMMNESIRWFSALYQDKYFDFKSNPDFIAIGKRIMRQGFELRRHMNSNTNFIFLNRTRYGLLRLFEMMEARVCFRNPYERSS